jgi:hypothetical protein
MHPIKQISVSCAGGMLAGPLYGVVSFAAAAYVHWPGMQLAVVAVDVGMLWG